MSALGVEPSTTLLDHAHRMLDKGLHVFPVDHPDHPRCIGKHGPTNPCDGQRGKHPAVKWGTWAIAATHQMLDLEWAKHGGIANIGIACGPSDLLVLDGDEDGELDRWAKSIGLLLPETYTVLTSRGDHRIYSWDHSARRIGNSDKATKGYKIDVRGDGGFIVAEHSRHQSGWVYTGNDVDIAPLPEEVAEVLLDGKPAAATPPTPHWEQFDGAADGDPNVTMLPMRERHKLLVKYASRLRSLGLDYAEAEVLFQKRWLLCEQPAGQIPEAKFHGEAVPYPVTWAEAKAKLLDVYERYGGLDDEPTTWQPLDLGPWLSGERVTPEPSVGISRSDGHKVLYPGREHSIFGETESGKTWLALECAAVEMRMGRDVLYIHYEEGDPGSTIERLRLLGLSVDKIKRHLRFVAPARPAQVGWLAELLKPPPSLVIHDGVNEAMSLHADKIMDPDGAAGFRRRLIKPCLRVGAATLACDHVTKSTDSPRGRYAIGSGHKVNAIDGAAFLVENIDPFGRGLRGASNVYVTKDRPGRLRAHGKPTGIAGKTYFGTLVVDATGTTPDPLMFYAPRDEEEDRPADTDLHSTIVEFIAALPGAKVASTRALLSAVRVDGTIKVRDTAVRNVVDDLVTARRLIPFAGPKNSTGYRVPSASQPSTDTSASRSASASASPIGGEAGSADTSSAAEELGSSRKRRTSRRRKPGSAERPQTAEKAS